ncbi:hypothetical protein kuro4_00430 [Gelria sp. Kuro-4]|nr:hypothetical protein kuro4_00430 [Gelria sp. Kuro-4]
MLTKKDFQALANMLNMATSVDNPDIIGKTSLVDQLCVYLKHKNPRFDAARFRAACEGKD